MEMSNPVAKISILLLLSIILFFTLVPNVASAKAAADMTVNDELFRIQRIVLQGNTLVSESAIQKATRKFIGENKALRDLENIRDAIYGVYQKAGYTLVSIAILDRPDIDGTLTVIAKEDVLRNIVIEGNKSLSKKDILRLLPALKLGQAINIKKLDEQVLIANENPSRVISTAVQTIDVGVFDAIVKVIEQKMISHTFSIDNTGNRYQDPLRISYRFLHNGLGGRRDATGILIYSRSPNDNIKQYLAYYNQPLGKLGDSVYAIAAKSNSATGLSNTGYGSFNVAGSGQYYSIHYLRPLYRSRTTKVALDFGIDYQSAVDETAFEGIDVGPDVNSRPLSLGLQYNWTGRSDIVSMNINYLRNIPGGYLNDDYTYGLSRINASSGFQLWRSNITHLHQFKNGWSFLSRLDGQYSTQPLIPDEEFGIGGVRSVRGFEEREALGDKGVSACFELYTPPLGHGVRLLAFFDIGQIWYFDPYQQLVGPQTLSSTGIGIRWTINKVFSLSADYAYVIKGYVTPAHDKRIHFNLSATF